MEGNNKINRVASSTPSSRPTNGHMFNAKAYSPDTKRLCKVNGKTCRYHFCSPTFTDHTKPTSSAVHKLEYVGEGTISQIGDEPYEGKDKNEKMHFWRIVSPISVFN